MNLGTPEEPTANSVADFLVEFLSDRRVIKMNPLFWQPLLRNVIIPLRSEKSAQRYQKIWSKEYGSPLRYYTQQQAKLLQKLVPNLKVRYAMSYCNPTINSVLLDMECQGIKNITVLPLYPQYSGTTVGSINDYVQKFSHQHKNLSIKTIQDFSDFQPYIDAVVKNMEKAIYSKRPDALIFSYHGIPVSYANQPDEPYVQRCTATTQAIMRTLSIDLPYFQSYQSKFGPGKWLTPSTSQMMVELPKRGYQNILVIAPGFVADCLETIYELNQENRQLFMRSGGKKFSFLNSLNDGHHWIKALKALVLAQ